jgi:hypothetical protein
MSERNNSGGVTIRDVTRTVVARQRLGKLIPAEPNADNRRVVFSVGAASRLYNDILRQLLYRTESLEVAVGRLWKNRIPEFQVSGCQKN